MMASQPKTYGSTQQTSNIFRSLHSSGSQNNERVRALRGGIDDGTEGRSASLGGATRVTPQCKYSELPLSWNDEEERDKTPASKNTASKGGNHTIFHYLVYAIINVIIAVPGLYGYASVIFNHPAFSSHMNALAKLVIFSSFVHQLGFIIFSSLDFAIGTVQDAGLIFLSAMANAIANNILDAGGTIDEVVSTTLVLLPLGTATLGLVLIFLGKFRLLDIVSYLPMPVIGGYLAFIGYFCLEAGVALCISKPMTTFSDWKYLFDMHSLLLATPGLLSALILTIISRKATSDAVLPIAMVLIPTVFYVVLFVCGVTLQDAREVGWVGQEAPPVPVQDLFHLVDFGLVHWGLISKCIGTWVGMVFVVSFASCLDIAAVSMDMGEALDTNKEMVTVGTANLMSGCLFGFTGSYIFSQTIFTYRTGCHSRYIGIFIMAAYLCVCASTINLLQIAPLFFLGATLIFIGYDLLWEWLIDIRSKIFLSEYFILLTTFVAIQIIGMDFGILFGVVVALVEHVASTTQRESTLERVTKRSRSVYPTEDWNILQSYGYNIDDPKIVTLEVKGPVFFGSSQKLLQDITDEIGLSISEDEMKQIVFASPHPSTPHSSLRVRPLRSSKRSSQRLQRQIHPQYLVLDMTQMTNLDASAASSCFLQLAKMCEKRGIFLCAAGVIPRVEWMLRSHKVAYSFEEEIELKNSMFSNGLNSTKTVEGKLMLFLTIFEALEFSERLLIRRVSMSKFPGDSNPRLPLSTLTPVKEGTHHQLTYIFLNVLRGELDEEERVIIDKDVSGYYEEVNLQAGEFVFRKNTYPDAFFVVTRGSVAVPRNKKGAMPSMLLSGAGAIKQTKTLSSPDLLGAIAGDKSASVESFHKVGGIFGYCDFLLERYRTFEAVSSEDDTIVAIFTKSSMDKMKDENRPLYHIVQNLLLRASLMDLANCTCHN